MTRYEYLKFIDFFVPVLEARPGYISGNLRDAGISIVASTFLTATAIYVDKYTDYDFGLYSSLAEASVQNGGVVYPSFYEDFTCSIHPDGQAILFDNDIDMAVNDQLFEFEGNIVLGAFNDAVINPEELNEIASANVIGHCSFYIQSADTGQREYYYTDAFPSALIGDFRPRF